MSDGKLPNDPSIDNNEVLYRGLHQDWIVPGDSGRMRIASAAFKNHELSVLIESLLVRDHRTQQDALMACKCNSLCSITAGLAREMLQGVVRDPDPPHDPAHGLVVGKKTKAVANRFAREALWVLPAEPPRTTV